MPGGSLPLHWVSAAYVGILVSLFSSVPWLLKEINKDSMKKKRIKALNHKHTKHVFFRLLENRAFKFLFISNLPD